MELNLNNLVVALSHALDFLEMDVLGVATNHSKRVAYIALRLGEEAGLSREELFDLITLALLHDNGIGAGAAGAPGASLALPSSLSDLQALDKGAEHCVLGEANISGYPFRTAPKNIIADHHENWDGSGFFHIPGDQIPLMAQIIRLADIVELAHDLRSLDWQGKRKVEAFLADWAGKIFAPSLVGAFREVSSHPAFWLDLKDDFIVGAIRSRAPTYSQDFPWAEVDKVTAIFSRIIDSKSRFTLVHSWGLSEKAAVMASVYAFPQTEAQMFHIAANLHDVGKLAISNAILDKPGKLEPWETDVIQRHTYYTRVSLQSIAGFESITEWAANHHEKLDGSGYPYRKSAEDLDLNSRLMACLDIYQALTEDRPYRAGMAHDRALGILRDMAALGKIDRDIVEDLDKAFA